MTNEKEYAEKLGKMNEKELLEEAVKSGGMSKLLRKAAPFKEENEELAKSTTQKIIEETIANHYHEMFTNGNPKDQKEISRTWVECNFCRRVFKDSASRDEHENICSEVKK